jgi:hypothetical protein
MSANIIGRRRLLSSAVDDLALSASRVQADMTFTRFAFLAAGDPTPRTMPDRLAEIVNVNDSSAVGDPASERSWARGAEDKKPPMSEKLDAAVAVIGNRYRQELGPRCGSRSAGAIVLAWLRRTRGQKNDFLRRGGDR